MRPSKGPQHDPGVRGGFRNLRALGPLLTGFLLLVPAPAFAAAADAATQEMLVLAAVTTGAVALAIAAGLWALAEQNVALKLRKALRQTNARTRAAVGERDALLSAGREALIVWGRETASPITYGSAERMLDACLAGPDATTVSAALDALSERGVAFALTAHDKGSRVFTLRGRAVGGMAAVWIEEDDVAAAAAPTTDFQAILDALPLPVWLRDKTLSLRWGNR
ncbi:MAG: hypothetical protein JO167_00295, partial [Alphaproteobacteria bacterium]|nr:hypothetical protein [Alphaproteobacteria bacterium]